MSITKFRCTSSDGGTTLVTVLETLAPALAGLGLGASLIIAIGAQNVFVLRQGLRREHVGAVIAVCASSDVVLIAAGVAGLGVLVERWPWAAQAARLAGAAFLVAYAALAARRAWRPQEEAADLGLRTPGGTSTSLRTTVLTATALTWLNPHVYLDTVFLLGSVANGHGPGARWAFALGAMLASILWFTALGLGSRLLARFFTSPRAWRVLDGAVALVMLAIAVGLLRG